MCSRIGKAAWPSESPVSCRLEQVAAKAVAVVTPGLHAQTIHLPFSVTGFLVGWVSPPTDLILCFHVFILLCVCCLKESVVPQIAFW